MLGSKNASVTLAVKDLAAARKFYEEVLGLTVATEQPWAVIYNSGQSMVMVYPSEFAGTNKATAATWDVDDVDGVVAALKAKGVEFEHYDNLPNTKVVGDVHVMEGSTEKVAWFKDPDGNILCIANKP